MFKPGKLYKCSEHFLMIYPSKEKAALAGGTRARSASVVDVDGPLWAAEWANYWSNILYCKVQVSQSNEIFMFLEKDGKYLHVLFGEVQGWIIYENWVKIKEI